MRTFACQALLAVTVAIPLAGQAPRAATYITSEEVQAVNRQPGIDRTIRVVDIGNENFAVGIIHRAASGAPAAGRASPPPATERCGDTSTGAPSDGAASGIAHDAQTEGYLIVSGAGTLVTGGRIVNGSRSGPESDVTKVLNGPSCSGTIVGADVVKRSVKTGDIIVIPAGVPHGWTGITDHVDYLSFRPSDHVLQAGYVHPSIRSGATPGGRPNFSGEWVMDTAASEKSSFNPRGTTYRVAHRGDTLTVDRETQSVTGDVVKSRMDWRIDGKPWTSTLRLVGQDVEASSVLAWAHDSLTIRTTSHPNGSELVQNDIWTLSPDGKTLTMKRSAAFAGQAIGAPTWIFMKR